MIYILENETPETQAIWIAPTAAIIGKVTFAPDTSIWWGAVLRGDNERITIGRGSNVQDNAVLHTDMGFPLTVGADVTVGHAAILHGCTIEDGALIGMGACVLNGARIGRNCIIGAKALVAEGKVIPDNSVVLGVPGRITGEARPEQIERALAGARHYVENARRFRDHLVVTEAQGAALDPPRGTAPWIPPR